MRLKVFGKTDIGQKRKINQDNILIDSKNKLFVVADGMGGHKGGEVASRIACQVIQSVVKEGVASGVRNPMELLRKGFKEATKSVYLEANKPGEDDLNDMGTTMVALFIYEKTAYIANVGDSRAYVFKKEFLWQITEDHSWVNEQLRAGLIQEVDLESISGKNVITRSIGFALEVNVDIFCKHLEVGEKYILCSDGLYGLVKNEWIQNCLLTRPTGTFVDEAILEANKNGGDDNVTCLFIEVES